MRTIEMCDEQVDEIVLSELTFAHDINSEYDDQHSKDIVAATRVLLQYYMTDYQYQQWLAGRSV